MDDQEQELERKLERALDALVWGRRQPDFSSNDRTKLLSDVTDARIELWELSPIAKGHGYIALYMKKKPGPRKGAGSPRFNDQPPPATIASLPAAIGHEGVMTRLSGDHARPV